MTTIVDGLFYQVLLAAQRELKAQLPQLPGVEIYEGEFDEEGIVRIVSKSRTLHIAFLGSTNVTPQVGGPATFAASYGIYVATDGKNRNRDAVNIMEGATWVLLRNQPGLGVPYTMEPIIGDIENLYSKKSGDRGVALFGLSFAVPIILNNDLFANDWLEYDPAMLTTFVNEIEVIDADA